MGFLYTMHWTDSYERTDLSFNGMPQKVLMGDGWKMVDKTADIVEQM